MKRLSMYVAGGFICLTLTGCGGSSPSGPTAAATPVPTPAPVSYTGTYSGAMAGTGNGVAAAACTAKTHVNWAGSQRLVWRWLPCRQRQSVWPSSRCGQILSGLAPTRWIASVLLLQLWQSYS